MGKVKPKKYFSKEILISQIEKILQEKGINQSEFNEAIKVSQAITKWKSGQTPSAESLLAIKKTFGISIDHLLTGEEPCAPEIAASPKEIYEARPLAPVEAELLNQILTIIEETLKEEKKALAAELKGRLISRIYNDCAEDRSKPHATMVKRYIWLLGE